MYRKSIPVLALTLLAVLALVAAGCGGGKKKNAAGTTTAAVTTTEATTTEATTTEATTTKATTTAPNLSGFASSKNCRDFASLAQKFSAAFSGSQSGANIKKEAELFQQFADKAPSDIRADFQTVAAYFSKVADVAGNLKPGQTPDAATLAKLQKLSTQVDTAKLTQASQRITAWVQKNCHA
jgi:hypothetical protein